MIQKNIIYKNLKYLKTYESKLNPEIKYWDNGNKGYEIWYLNGKKHREDGPAYQSWYKNGQKYYERWYLNGKSHREDGPVSQEWHENGQKEYESWYLNDKEYSKEDWLEELKRIGSKHYGEQQMIYNTEKYNL